MLISSNQLFKIRWKITANVHFLFCYRVGKINISAMKCLSVYQIAFIAVQTVTDKRKADV